MTTTSEPSLARCPGPSWQDLLDREVRPVPASMRAESPYLNGMDDVPKERYLSRARHELEKERLWSRVWQFACREEHLPKVGSYVVYEICDRSYIVVRSAQDEIRAYPNACLHRGRALKTYDGRCDEFRCPFHGFTWQLDGALKSVPADWDFPYLEDRAETFVLPAIRVGVWEGFVFINPDPAAEPLEQFLGVLPEHFARWRLGDRYVQAHVAKVIRCNWKIAIEAFSEGYHVGGTHPQAVPYVSDPMGQIDVWGNVARQMSPSGMASPLMAWEPTEEQILRAMLDIREGEALPIELAAGQTARAALAERGRERWRPVVGDLVDELTDSEFVDHFNYTVFPNTHPWGAFNRICYRFRPNGDDHESCIFEVFFITPFTGARPEPAVVRWLDEDEPWAAATELDTLGMVLDQDTFNMQHVHRGLKSLTKPGISLSRYQEAIVRWRHDLIAAYIDRGAP